MIDLTITPGLWFILIVLAAMIDYLIGDPAFLLHPIILIGKFIGFLTKYLNKGRYRRLKGALMVIIVITVVYTVIILMQYFADQISPYLCMALNLWFLSTALAEKSLYLAGKKCQAALLNNDIESAREYTGEIVGRDTAKLNRHDIMRAVIETEAENGIDGIISPLFYMFLGVIFCFFTPALNPLALAYIYKSVNTMDSMVGYIHEPYTYFGYVPAKLDDLLNFIPARIGSLLLLLAGKLQGYDYNNALKIYNRDKGKHASPNAGHPEAAIAGILGVQIGGSNVYFGHILKKPTLGDSTYNLKPRDIKETMSLVLCSEILFICIGAILITVIYTFLSFT